MKAVYPKMWTHQMMLRSMVIVLPKKKEKDSYAILRGRKGRSHDKNQRVAFVTPVINMVPTAVAYQREPQQGNQGKVRREKLLILFQ